MKLEPFTNPFPPFAYWISIISFIIHIIFLLALEFYSYSTYKYMVESSDKRKMMFIATAFFALGIADIFYFLSFLVLVFTGSTSWRVDLNGFYVYPYSIFEALFRVLATVFLLSIISYALIQLKDDISDREAAGLTLVGAIAMILQVLPYNYFGFKVEGAPIFIRPINDTFLGIIALIAIYLASRIYFKTAASTTDVLIRRRRLAFFMATVLVSFGIIGVFLSSFMATLSMDLIYSILIFEVIILLLPPVLYYISIFASEELAKKFLRI